MVRSHVPWHEGSQRSLRKRMAIPHRAEVGPHMPPPIHRQRRLDTPPAQSRRTLDGDPGSAWIARSELSPMVGDPRQGDQMTAPSSSRQAILKQIRTATQIAAKESYADLPRNYIRRGKLEGSARLALMMERLREYGADVLESNPADLPAVIAQQLQSSGRHVFVAPPGLPRQWLTAGFDWKIDHSLSHDDIHPCDGVVTAAFAGVADSGTIVLHHSLAEG